MVHFEYFTAANAQQLTTNRSGEEKLGQHIYIFDNWESLLKSKCQYVIFGAREDAGVIGNKGIGGADTNWGFFLKSFLNIQNNQFFQGSSICILGNFERSLTAIDHSAFVAALDLSLSEMVSQIRTAGKIPILIGGGHNNAYGMLKGSSNFYSKAINVINLDPHADLREMDYRHSGNGFSYAKNDGYLDKYAMLGLHEAYNNTYILKQINDNPSFLAIYFEDIVMRQTVEWMEAVSESFAFVNSQQFGVELDMDAIENTLSSALTPIGIAPKMAYQYLYKAGLEPNSCYLHIAEAVAIRADGMEQKTIGKLLSYFVQAFIKGKMDVL